MDKICTIDDQLIIHIMELLHTIQEACPELYCDAECGNEEQFQRLCCDAASGLNVILLQLGDYPGCSRIRPICQSAQDTLNRVSQLYMTDWTKCLQKIEFELLPLLQEAYAFTYFFLFLAAHPEEKDAYYNELKNQLFGNAYIDDALEKGQFKYDVSFYVVAYNKLDYTRRCMESLLENMPSGLNYELILMNHGSTDGTKEYFESIHPHKQLDLAVNGVGFGVVERILEGEYAIQVSNDLIITPHAIENLLTCIRSDPKIAWVVPTTPNISNFQTIPAQYASQAELLDFAVKNNVSNPFRWEQRARLCNPIDVRRSSVFYSSKGLCLNGWYHTVNPVHYYSFPDDRLSLLLRRNGYKIMLAKDAYCHHFGSVTLKDEIRAQNEQKYYQEGRKEFFNTFHVDPWGTGFCFDPIFLERLVGDEQGHVEVLGINCGLGSNSLKIKEQIKEYCHNLDCHLTNITDDESFLADLSGISDEATVVSSIKEFKEFLRHKKFQYIVWETPFLTGYHKFEVLLSYCKSCLGSRGKLFIKTNKAKLPMSPKSKKTYMLGNGWICWERE